MLELDRANTTLVCSTMAGGPPTNRIAELRVAKGWTQQQLAEACRPPTTQATIDRLEDGTRQLKQAWMDRIAGALRVSPGDLLPQKDPQQPAPPSVTLEGATRDLQSHLRPLPTASAKDLPILGRAKGGEDAFSIDDDGPVIMTYRPHLLDGVPGSYAVETWDNSMDPVLEHGFLLWVNPHKPVKPGDIVVIQLKDGQALVKRLLRRTEKDLLVRQYTPPKDFKIARANVKSVHLVVGNTRGMA